MSFFINFHIVALCILENNNLYLDQASRGQLIGRKLDVGTYFVQPSVISMLAAEQKTNLRGLQNEENYPPLKS